MVYVVNNVEVIRVAEIVGVELVFLGVDVVCEDGPPALALKAEAD